MGHNWMSAQVVNSHLVCDPTIRQPCFDLPRQQWSLLNRFRTEQGHCDACRRKWRLTDTDLCPCGESRETQTMFHIVESCLLTKLAAYLGYTLRMKTLFCGWPVMLDDTHTRRRLCPTCWQLHSVVFVSLRLYEPGHLLLPGVSIHTTMVGSRRDWWTEVAIARLRLGGRLHRCISCCPNLQILTEMWHSVTTFAQRISLMIIWLLGTIPNRQASFYRLPCLIG